MDLFCLLEPLLILRGLLPALVCRAGANQVHVGAEVLAVGAGTVAGAVSAEAEVFGGERRTTLCKSTDQISTLIANIALDRPRFRRVPELSPRFQVVDLRRRLIV